MFLIDMYLVRKREIKVTGKTFVIYDKKKIYTYNVKEQFRCGKIYKLEITYTDNTKEVRILNDNTMLMGLHEIPNTWFEDSTTIKLPYKAKLIRVYPHSGLSSKMIKALELQAEKEAVTGTLLNTQGNNQFLIDGTNEIVTIALNSFNYTPLKIN